MKYVWSSIFVILLILAWSIPTYHVIKKIAECERFSKASISQQLIDDRIKLEIIVSEQKNTIDSLDKELATIRAERDEVFKAALEIAGENFVLNKVIDGYDISMKQMLEYIQKLEGRDA